MDATPQTLAAKIRILAESGLTPAEIAAELDTNTQYVHWAIWTAKNREKRRAWEANYRKTQYWENLDVRERTLARQASKRARNNDKQGRP